MTLITRLPTAEFVSPPPEIPPPPSMRYPGLFQAMCFAEVRPDGIDIADLDARPGFDDPTIMANWLAFIPESGETEKEAVTRFAEAHFIFPVREAPAIQEASHHDNPEDYCRAVLYASVRRPYINSSSQIGVDEEILEPGGRFGVPKEGHGRLFNWDSAPTLRGAVALDREWGLKMAHSTLRAFEQLADRLGGCIPNVNTTWAANRSHPPNLIDIVRLIAQYEGTQTYITYLPLLEKHFNFWRDGADDQLGAEAGSEYRRVVRMPNGLFMYRHWDDADGPRDEMFLEDMKTLDALREETRTKFKREPTDHEIKRLFKSLRASAESGEDFRIADARDKKNLHSLRTVELAPVKLNSLMYEYAGMLAEAYQLKAIQDAGTPDEQISLSKVRFYQEEAINLATCIEEYCISDDDFLADYDFVNQKTERGSALAGVFALKAGVFTQAMGEHFLERVEERFRCKGGLVNTRHKKSEQQWDSNVWPIMQLAAIDGAIRYGRYDLAYTWAKRWIKSQDKMFARFKAFFEKSRPSVPGEPGGAGEYACVKDILMTLGADAAVRDMLQWLEPLARQMWRDRWASAAGNLSLKAPSRRNAGLN